MLPINELEEILKSAPTLQPIHYLSLIDDGGGIVGEKYKITIVSDIFVGKPLLMRHRLVNSVLEQYLSSGKLHSVQIRALTIAQYDERRGNSDDIPCKHVTQSIRAISVRGRLFSSTVKYPIQAEKVVITNTSTPKALVEKEKLVFGHTMTDHMLELDWQESKEVFFGHSLLDLCPNNYPHEDNGWSVPEIRPYHALSIDPSSSVLHYAVEAFEGMKAYKDGKGLLRLFRPDLNLQRLNASMVRMCLPELDQPAFLELLKRFTVHEKRWVPEGDGYSLYLRPTIIGTQASLGVAQSKSAKLFCIASPVGPYYSQGFKPTKLLAESVYVRAWPGGTGAAKVGGNYAPTIFVQAQAAQKGYNQVLWLFGPNGDVTEAGTMNFFTLWTNKNGEKELVTAPLDGTILPGVTRQSVLDLARAWGDFKVSERKYTITEVIEGIKEGRVHECFGTGTAAVVSPVNVIGYKGEDYKIPLDPNNPSAGAGPLANRIWNSLLDIQYGKIDHPWSVLIE